MIHSNLHDGRRVVVLVSGRVIRRETTLISPAAAVDELNAVQDRERERERERGRGGRRDA